MTLNEVNKLWKEYKEKYNIKTDREISDVRFDTEEYVEGCFNLLELMDDTYILHLNPKINTYSESYVKFILFHEFTHFYDFFNCPFEEKEDLLFYMNAYSEYHACRVTLAKALEVCPIKTIHMNKIQIPGPYSEISVRQLLEECLYRVKYNMDLFFLTFDLNDIVNAFRHLMYLFGYLSVFTNDKALVAQTMDYLNVSDPRFIKLYDALKATDLEDVVAQYRSISDTMITIYLRASFRRYYDEDILPDDEIQNITKENYQEYIDLLERRKAERELKEAGVATAAAAFVNDFIPEAKEIHFIDELKKHYHGVY